MLIEEPRLQSTIIAPSCHDPFRILIIQLIQRGNSVCTAQINSESLDILSPNCDTSLNDIYSYAMQFS